MFDLLSLMSTKENKIQTWMRVGGMGSDGYAKEHCDV